MWSHESGAALGRAGRWLVAVAVAAMMAGCFQPLYGERTETGGSELRQKLAAVDVVQIAAPQGTPDARVAVELRNDLLFQLYGGSGAVSPTHRLNIKMTTSKSALIVDIATGRTVAEITGIDVTYTLVELATGKVVVNGTSFSRVSSDVPGLQQRFARARAQRDAENRAAGVVADEIKTRLASYMVART
ncbi:MAG: LPS assembly lipoprotein LptE [Xanthobacteraceae bacterium]|jgi:LPS-assembly lipoprotein